MKKLSSIIFLLIITLALGLSANVKAESTDLYDDSTRNSTGSTEIELLANSNYQLNILRDDSVWNNNDFIQTLGQGTLGLEVYGAHNTGYEGDSDYWITFSTYTASFSTTNSTSLFIDVYCDDSEALGLLYPNVDIQVIWLGNTEPVDDVPPQYTYSNVSIDTPYYDLATLSEIQAQLQATDDEDGDVTDRIQIYEDHYTSITPKVVGDEYYIMFMVDDLSGNAAYLRVDINVIDDKRPVFEVSQEQYTNGSTVNFSWYDDAYDSSNDEIDQFLSHISVIDEYYGEEYFNDSGATNWTFNVTYPTGYNPAQAGNYTITVSATDPSNNTASISLVLTVIENQAPVITGPDTINVEIVGFDSSDILSQYSASDTEDGALTVTIENLYHLNDPGSELHGENILWTDTPSLGSFFVTLSTIDSLGIITEKEVMFNLVDTSLPVFKIDDIPTTNYSHTVYMSDTSTLQALIDSIVVIDPYYGDITKNMVVPKIDGGLLDVPGNEVITLEATDASGNTSTLDINVTVVDDILPVINGATKIVKGKTEVLTLSNIQSYLSAIDNVDGNLSIELVQDGYSGNSSVIGSYLVKYKATDTAGNTKYHDVRIWVVDNTAPAWIVNDYFVNLGINEVMSRSELVSLLQASGMIGSDISYTVTFLTDEYTGNENIEGAYSVVMNITYEDGSESVVQVELNVPETDEGDVIVVEPEPNQTGFQKFITSVLNVGKSILNFVKNAWNWIKDTAVWIYDHIIYPVYEFIFVKDTQVIPTVTTETPEATTYSSVTVQDLPVTTTSSPIMQV